MTVARLTDSSLVDRGTLWQGGSVYRPRVAATLTVPVIGTRDERIGLAKSENVITYDVTPTRTRIERNDHNSADTCSLTLDWTAAGIDARMLDDATVEVHIANADDDGYWQPSVNTVRFAGIVKEVNCTRPEDDVAEVTLECMDYTALFLAAKPFGSSGVPQLSQTLLEAWQTIVSQTPGAEIFSDPKRLVFQDVDPSLVLGKGVSERFRKFTQVQTKPETDAWAVWMMCVGMLGLISYIEDDRCVVTTATNYYTERDAPTMVWGHNILSWHESRISALSKKGVWITSYNPETLQTIEAEWPPIGDDRVKRKRATAKKKLSTDQIRQREERDFFAFAGVSSAEDLLDIAKRVYEERSRQELEGAITTAEMWTETEQRWPFNLLNLRAGETVRVEVNQEQKQMLSSFESDAERMSYLTDRGYTEGAAQLIIANMKNFARLDARFLTKSVSIDLATDDTGGEFMIEIGYVNRIQIDGSARE